MIEAHIIDRTIEVLECERLEMERCIEQLKRIRARLIPQVALDYHVARGRELSEGCTVKQTGSRASRAQKNFEAVLGLAEPFRVADVSGTAQISYSGAAQLLRKYKVKGYVETTEHGHYRRTPAFPQNYE